MLLRSIAALLLVAPALMIACGDDDDDKKDEEGCTVGDNSTCPAGLECQAVAGGSPDCFCTIDTATGCEEAGTDFVCEPVQGGNSACFAPIYVKGMVFDLATKAPIEGAHVVARDANNAAVSGVAITDPAGNYALRVSGLRDKDGKPLSTKVTLRADADGYLGFPKPPRIALPIELAGAVAGDAGALTVQSSATDIAMLALQSTTGLGTIKGKVLHDTPRGTLVVAGGATGTGGAATGVADYDGSYTVFNVPAGSVGVRGFKAGLQLEPTSANVEADKITEGVDLKSLGKATAVVSGKIELVNPGAGKETSVILAVDETFNDLTAHGEAPPGLRVFPVVGDFSIPNVPDGKYVVLAAFENDFLVRDPDQAIGGTKIVRISVAGANIAMSDSFKVTGALDVVGPTDEAVVSTTPTFEWNDDSGEDHYEIVVYNAFGELMWEDKAIPGVSGDKTVKVTYPSAAPAKPLVPGVIYQFRATSIKQGGTAISRTEDLKGTFLVQ